MMGKEDIISAYFEAWITNNIDLIPEIFASDIIYSECYGPEYHGLNQIIQWFKDWHMKGSVLEWRIKRFIHENRNTAVEWFFKCNYQGKISGFDGVSLIVFNDANQIKEVKEFKSKADHYFPYGK